MTITVETKKDAIMAIKMLERGFDIKHNDVWVEEEPKINVSFPFSSDMLQTFICHLSTSSVSLEKKWKKLTYEQKKELVDKGCTIGKKATADGVKSCYYGNDELALYCVMKAIGYK